MSQFSNMNGPFPTDAPEGAAVARPETLEAFLDQIEQGIRQNRIEEAELRLGEVSRFQAEVNEANHPVFLARCEFLRGAIALARGDVPTAIRRLDRSLKRSEERGDALLPAVQRTRLLLARACFAARDTVRSEELLRQDHALQESAIVLDDARRMLPLALLADQLFITNQFAEAETLYERLLPLRRAASPPSARPVAEVLGRLAVLRSRRGQHREAEPLFLESLGLFQEAVGNKHPEVARVLNDYAESLHAQGRLDHAEDVLGRALRIQEKSLRVTDPRMARTRNNLAAVYVGRQRFVDAERLYREEVELKRHGMPGHSSLATALNNLGETLRQQGRNEDAEGALIEALKIRVSALGETHPQVAQSHSNLAKLYLTSGRTDEARIWAERAFGLRKAVLPQNDPLVAVSLLLCAEIETSAGRHDAAGPLLTGACDLFSATPEAPQYGLALLAAAKNAALRKRRTRLELYLRRAVVVTLNTHGEQHPIHARALVRFADWLCEAGKADEAQPLLNKSLPVLQDASEDFAADRGVALYRLAMSSRRGGDPQNANKLIETALPYLANSDRHAEVLIESAVCQHDLGATADAFPRLLEGLELLPDDPDRAPERLRALELLSALQGPVPDSSSDATGPHGCEHAARTLPLLSELVGLRLLRGDYSRAALPAEQCVRLAERIHGPGSPEVQIYLDQVASIQQHLCDPQQQTVIDVSFSIPDVAVESPPRPDGGVHAASGSNSTAKPADVCGSVFDDF